ncbi:hypothetical protein HDU67_001958 [Dinochytrium kinnereticum]|nr:hypothetical protein HDU67_001958 [Dinochytrium kinnereticum]
MAASFSGGQGGGVDMTLGRSAADAGSALDIPLQWDGIHRHVTSLAAAVVATAGASAEAMLAPSFLSTTSSNLEQSHLAMLKDMNQAWGDLPDMLQQFRTDDHWALRSLQTSSAPTTTAMMVDGRPTAGAITDAMNQLISLDDETTLPNCSGYPSFKSTGDASPTSLRDGSTHPFLLDTVFRPQQPVSALVSSTSNTPFSPSTMTRRLSASVAAASADLLTTAVQLSTQRQRQYAKIRPATDSPASTNRLSDSVTPSLCLVQPFPTSHVQHHPIRMPTSIASQTKNGITSPSPSPSPLPEGFQIYQQPDTSTHEPSARSTSISEPYTPGSLMTMASPAQASSYTLQRHNDKIELGRKQATIEELIESVMESERQKAAGGKRGRPQNDDVADVASSGGKATVKKMRQSDTSSTAGGRRRIPKLKTEDGAMEAGNGKTDAHAGSEDGEEVDEKDLLRRRRNTLAARRSRERKNSRIIGASILRCPRSHLIGYQKFNDSRKIFFYSLVLSHTSVASTRLQLDQLEHMVKELEHENSMLNIRTAVLENEKSNLLIRQMELVERVRTLEVQLEEAHRSVLLIRTRMVLGDGAGGQSVEQMGVTGGNGCG